jgi:hypothetical protein
MPTSAVQPDVSCCRNDDQNGWESLRRTARTTKTRVGVVFQNGHNNRRNGPGPFRRTAMTDSGRAFWKRVTGPNTLGVVSTPSGYSSKTSNMRGVLFGTLSKLYFQQNTSFYISHDTDTMMTHYDTGGTEIP